MKKRKEKRYLWTFELIKTTRANYDKATMIMSLLLLLLLLSHEKALLPVTIAYVIHGKYGASGNISHIMQGSV